MAALKVDFNFSVSGNFDGHDAEDRRAAARLMRRLSRVRRLMMHGADGDLSHLADITAVTEDLGAILCRMRATTKGG